MPRLLRRRIGAHVLVLDERTSARMAKVRQRGTAPELLVRKALARLGHRYRVDNRDLPGSPDVANRARRWSILVHGCYWHRHPGCAKATTPTRNAEFWVAKFESNVARDRRVVAELRALGYLVLVIWECEASEHVTLARRLRALGPGPCKRG